MIVYENDCVGCATDGYPCDPCCTRKRAKHFYCDECGCEEQLYLYDGRQLCMECIDEIDELAFAEVEAVDESEES